MKLTKTLILLQFWIVFPPLYLRSTFAVPPLMLKRTNGGRAEVDTIQYLTAVFLYKQSSQQKKEVCVIVKLYLI